MLTNLVENAAKYASPKGMRVERRRSTATRVRVSVHDRGEGIPAADLPACSTKFFRRDHGRPTGTGSGSGSAAGLVEAHGGELVADVTSGRGQDVLLHAARPTRSRRSVSERTPVAQAGSIAEIERDRAPGAAAAVAAAVVDARRARARSSRSVLGQALAAQRRSSSGSARSMPTSGAKSARPLNARAADRGGARARAAPSSRRRARGRGSRPSGSTSPRCRPPRGGHLHLVTQAIEQLEDVFVGMGFTVAEGPEVETDWHNFEALNFPPGHPARDMYDTLYVELRASRARPSLRTHTSPVQIRVMETQPPPIYAVMPGPGRSAATPPTPPTCPCSTRSRDWSIDRGITFGDLAGTIDAFTKAYFGGDFGSRLRPSYFPFTEPSAEFDIRRPDGVVARARRLRHGPPQRASQLRHRPRGVVGLRVRVRHRPPGQPRATASTTSASSSPTTSAS